jgi:hypothetical protein
MARPANSTLDPEVVDMVLDDDRIRSQASKVRDFLWEKYTHCLKHNIDMPPNIERAGNDILRGLATREQSAREQEQSEQFAKIAELAEIARSDPKDGPAER